MGNPLRDRRPLAEFAAKGQVIEIADKIGDFKRLAQIVETDLAALDTDRIPRDWRDAVVTGTLAFGISDARSQVVTLEGDVSVNLYAVCQRCLEPFRMPLAAAFRVLAVAAGDDSAATGDFEIWELDDDTVCPADFVEEALVMAMPLSAMHEVADECQDYTELAQDTEQTTKPFAGLKAQLDESS